MNRRKSYRLTALLVCMMLLLSGCGIKDPLFLTLSSQKEQLTAPGSEKNEVVYDWQGQDILLITDAEETSSEAVNAIAALLYSLDSDKAYFAKSADRRLRPAELTYLFTAYTALQYIRSDTVFTVQKEALEDLNGFDVIGLKEGDRVKAEDLLCGMLRGGADAARALAIACAGSEEEFVSRMNVHRKTCGCMDSSFANVIGRDDSDQYTTVYDVYLLMHRLARDARFMKAFSADNKEITVERAGLEMTLSLPAAEVKTDGGIDVPAGLALVGSLEGSSSQGGYCMSMITQDGAGSRNLMVILCAWSPSGMYDQAEELFKMAEN